VHSKEQADHSLFYLAAVALLDGEIYPEQFEPERINRSDVQELLQKIHIDTKFPLHKPIMVAGMLDPYTIAYPEKMKAKAEIVLKDGNSLVCEAEDYHGFYTRPFSWEDCIGKFKRLVSGIINERQMDDLIYTVQHLDDLTDMQTLIQQLSIKQKQPAEAHAL